MTVVLMLTCIARLLGANLLFKRCPLSLLPTPRFPLNHYTGYTSGGSYTPADQKGNRPSQTPSEILQAIDALPTHAEITAELRKLRFHLRDDQKQQRNEDQHFLQELSHLDFTAMQKESHSKRHNNTGQWLLESSEFQAWQEPEGGEHSVLWYRGGPGVGKTVATFIAVNHVTEKNRGRVVAIVYIYFHYANTMDFSAENLLGSIVRQLVEQTWHGEKIAELKMFLENPARNRKLTEDDCSSWIETLSSTFDLVYTFVDALDECPEDERDKLLRRLQRYSLDKMRVFLTSRSNVDVMIQIPHAIETEIAATSDDLTAYLESKILESSRLARLTNKDIGLKQHIISTICDQANGMFLLARLQIEGLGIQTSARGVRSALERLLADLFAVYDQTMERIRCQSSIDAALGWNVLSMIFGAFRPLKVDELRHALAIQPGDRDLDFEALVDLETLLSVTVGLVTMFIEDEGSTNETRSVRLVHYTLQEYFECNQKRPLNNLELKMARACLSYLSLDEFRSEILSLEEKVELGQRDLSIKRLNDYPFLNYASKYWAYHLHFVQTELIDQSLAFVQDRKKISAWLQILHFTDCYIGLDPIEDLPLDPCFLAAHFLLSELVKRLISSCNINTEDSRGKTLLIRAVDADRWQWRWGADSPIMPMEERIGKTERYGTIARSPSSDQYAIIQVILDLDADVDAKDLHGRTAAFSAVETGNCGTLSLLLDRGANVNARMKGGISLLHFAVDLIVREGPALDCLQILLDRSADVNVLTKSGRSVVQLAAATQSLNALDRLVDHGAQFDVADKAGHTPLMIAAWYGRLEIFIALSKLGARRDVTDILGRTPLHFAVRPLSLEMVEVAMRGQEIDVTDINGRTPLHYAHFWSARYERFDEAATVMRRLIEEGASETIADAHGRIPKDYYLLWPTYHNEPDWKYKYMSPDNDESEEDSESDEDSGNDRSRTRSMRSTRTRTRSSSTTTKKATS